MNAFILHSSSLQTRVWQKLLRSQKWTVSTFSQEEDFQQAIETKQPDVVLIAETIPGMNIADICKLLSSNFQDIPIIMLAKSSQGDLTSTQRQLAKTRGAYELLPAFSLETIAIEAVKGVKCVVELIGGKTIQNSDLMNCIVGLKQEFDPVKSQAVDRDADTRKITRTYRGQEYIVELPAIDVPKTETRRYRGQEY